MPHRVQFIIWQLRKWLMLYSLIAYATDSAIKPTRQMETWTIISQMLPPPPFPHITWWSQKPTCVQLRQGTGLRNWIATVSGHITHRPPHPRFQLSVVYRGLKKIWKMKEISCSYISKCVPGKDGPWHGEIQQPKHAQYLTHLPLSLYPSLPANLPPFCF